MTKGIDRICAGYHADELALIIEFLERPADARMEAAAEVSSQA